MKKVEERLLQYINKKRQKMINLALKKGFTSKEAVKCSQELDQLLNLYESFNQNLHIMSRQAVKRNYIICLLVYLNYKRREVGRLLFAMFTFLARKIIVCITPIMNTTSIRK
ncbi:Spo0E family sporulation regulatory protein-aspartic acid phosphatase [Halobacillus sp. A5]|uniref:Spo0E family sporulation regulatory protein-aspartic acid phosphatase n=1 Tax=Halobacillus sp. A5 TaxID=2880263 RepID=UPI0035319160